MGRTDGNTVHGLFSVQTKKRRAFPPAGSGQQVAQVLAVLLVMVVLLWKGLYGISIRNFEAESSGLQGRKVGPGQGSASVGSPEQQKSYVRMVREHLHDVDLEALKSVCGAPEGVAVNERCDGQGSISAHLHILGERHCGSNAAADLIHANFDIILEPQEKIRKRFPWVKVGEFQREFGLNNHKHNMQQDDGHFYPGLTVISIRNAYDWVKSMMRDCYFCDAAQMRAGKKGPLEFVSTPWQKGAHIAPGESFHDIFDLRMKKFCNHLKVAITSSDCVVVVRAEENVLPIQQEAFVGTVHNLTGWPMKTTTPTVLTAYRGRAHAGNSKSIEPKEYFGRSVYFQSQVHGLQEDAELVEAVNARMNPTFEKLLGYDMIV